MKNFSFTRRPPAALPDLDRPFSSHSASNGIDQGELQKLIFEKTDGADKERQGQK